LPFNQTEMKRLSMNGLYLWQFENLALQPATRHYVSDRYTSGEEFTLSLSSTPDKEKVRTNRAQLAAILGVTAEQMFFPSQVHGTDILTVSRATLREELHDKDALITAERGVCISVMSADCVTILLYDKRNHVCGAVHSGWRGTVAHILSKTLRKMSETYNSKGQDIIAAIGPSVCQDSYEVGEEVIEEVNRSFGSNNRLMLYQPNNKAKLDLWEANRLQLLDFGVSPANIEVSELCTVKNNDHFFSARKGDKGRFAAGIVLV
jgi:polyphenol oxidase